jgi:hypothetical protein
MGIRWKWIDYQYIGAMASKPQGNDGRPNRGMAGRRRCINIGNQTAMKEDVNNKGMLPKIDSGEWRLMGNEGWICRSSRRMQIPRVVEFSEVTLLCHNASKQPANM